MNQDDHIEVPLLLCITVVIGIIIYVRVMMGIYGF